VSKYCHVLGNMRRLRVHQVRRTAGAWVTPYGYWCLFLPTQREHENEHWCEREWGV